MFEANLTINTFLKAPRNNVDFWVYHITYVLDKYMDNTGPVVLDRQCTTHNEVTAIWAEYVEECQPSLEWDMRHAVLK